MAIYDYERLLLSQIESLRMQLLARPLNLGGVSGSDGGAGGPPGGFTGYLPQTRVAYDETEAEASGTSVSGSLVDNLNHIRYRIKQLEDSATPPGLAPLDVYDNGELVEAGVTVIDFGDNIHAILENDRVVVSVSGVTASGGSGNTTYSDTYANQPASANEGDLFFPTDSNVIKRHEGTSWLPWGPLYSLVEPPAVGDFTWVNQMNATAAKNSGAIYMVSGGNWSENDAEPEELSLLVKAAPTLPYTLTVAFVGQLYEDIDYYYTRDYGIALRQETNGNIMTFGKSLTGITSDWWNSATAYGVNMFEISPSITTPLLFLRIYDSSTTKTFSYSFDGINFISIYDTTHSNPFTADQIGIYTRGHGANVCQTILSWEIT
jgi:hypothetical protein